MLILINRQASAHEDEAMPFTRKLPCTATRRILHGLCSELGDAEDAEDAGRFVAVQMSANGP